MNDIELIKDRLEHYCEFTPSTCYILLLLARKKENPELTEKHKLEKCNRLLIHTQEDIDHALEEMLSRARLSPGLVFRVYVSVNPRSLLKGLYEMITRLARISLDLINGNTQAYTTLARLGSEFKSLLAERACRASRRLLFDVDFDNKTTDGISNAARFHDSLYPLSVKVYANWPTLNGFAVVTDPFNVQDLGKLPEGIEIKSDDYLYLGVLNHG